MLRLRSFEADVGRELSCSSLTLPAVALLPSKMLPSLCHNRSPSSPTSTPTIRACCAPSQVKQREFPAKMRTTARGGRGGAVAGRGNLGRETAARAVARQQVKFLSTEETRERAREGVMTREERLLGEMAARSNTTRARSILCGRPRSRAVPASIACGSRGILWKRLVVGLWCLLAAADRSSVLPRAATPRADPRPLGAPALTAHPRPK